MVEITYKLKQVLFMLKHLKDIKKIIVINEDNVIINVLKGIPANVEYDENGEKKKVILTPITSIEQLRFSLPLDLVYVRLNKDFEQVDSGILKLTHDNYNEFVSSEQVINL